MNSIDELKTIIKELLSYKTEKEWFEFKLNWFNANELGEYISALSNSAFLCKKRTAYFVWGVNDKTHEIEGTTFDYDLDVNNEPLKHFLSRQLSPDVNFEFSEIHIEGRRLVVLSIPTAKDIPVSFRNERFIRIGSSKENLRRYPQREAQLFHLLFKGLPTIQTVSSRYQELTFENLFARYMKEGLVLNRTTFEKNLGLLTEEGKYNLMAQLLADDSHTSIRFGVFKGRTKADKLITIREFGYQCLLDSIDKVIDYGELLNEPQIDERNRLVERKEIPLFDMDAFREATINAFLHNDWTTGNEPMFTAYSNRIEILSRGSIPQNQTIEGFFSGTSVPVNEKLSEILLQLHISEKMGRGVPTITKAYGRTVFDIQDNSIKVTIPFNRIFPEDEPGYEEKERNKESNLERVKPSRFNPSNTQTKVYREMKRNPNVTIAQLANKLKVSTTAIDNAVYVLKSQGMVVREGSKKNGYWETCEID